LKQPCNDQNDTFKYRLAYLLNIDIVSKP